MTLLKLISWSILLLVLSIMSGFLTFLVDKPLTPRSDYVFIAIIGTFGIILLVGALAVIPFFVLRKSILETRLKRSFQVYTFFCLALIAVACFKFPEAMKERRNFEFIQRQGNAIHHYLSDKVNVEANKLSIKLTPEQEEDIVDFLFATIEMNDEMMDRMFESQSIHQFILTDPKVTEETKMTIDWKLNTTK